MAAAKLLGLRLVSLMAANADFFYRGLVDYLAQQTAVPIEPVESVPWQEREQMLDRGEAQIGFICGLPYVRPPCAAACARPC